MKLFALILLGLVALTLALPNPPHQYPRGCRHIMGRCVEACPVGTREYHTACSPKTPEATCEVPHPVPETGDTCDYSACHCDAPTVRDPVTDQCVKLEDCSKQ